jgi:hypothetical protein
MSISSKTFAPRLLAGFGTLALVAAVGLFASSRPAHTAGGPIAVAVSNLPLPTTAADSPAKQPFEVQFFLSQSGTPASQGGAPSIFYTVPAGKRLVIEYVNVVSNIPNDPDDYSFVLITGSVSTNFNVVPSGSPYSAASEKVLLYAEAGTPVSGYFQYSGSYSSPQIYGTLSGYLVDVP